MNAHVHDFAPVGDARGRCRLCTANDLDALVEEIAATMWESRREGVMCARSWADAGDYWQKPFREMARAVAEGFGR